MAGIVERGTVTAASGGLVNVRVAAGSACGNCSACCHVDRDGTTVEGARDTFGAVVGDEVEVEIPEGTDTRAGLIVFILPAAGLLAGYAGGYLAGLTLGVAPDTAGAVGAVAAIAGAFLALRARGRDALSDERFRPRVRAIIAPGLSASRDSGNGTNSPAEAGSEGRVRT